MGDLMTTPIFHDPSGKRAKRAGFAGAVALSLVAAVVAGFAATLAFAPRLPDVSLKNPKIMSALHVETAHRLKAKPTWTRVPRPLRNETGARTAPLILGFYAPYDPNSRASLAQHVGQLDVVSPQWVALKDAAGAVALTDDPQGVALLASAPKHPAVLPLVHNSANEAFNGAMADALLANPAARKALIANLLALADAHGYAGYVFDLENMSARGQALYPGFIAEANAAFQPSGREVWVTAPFDREGWPLEKLQKASDTLLLMAYDEHYKGDAPGPNAGQDWYEKELAQRFKELTPGKTIIAFGAYGYDWITNAKGPAPLADAVTFPEAMQRAHDSETTVDFDPDSLNPTFSYENDDGTKHEVWFIDAPVIFNQIKVSDAFRPRGYGLWRLGQEDPGIWNLLGKPFGTVQPTGLNVMDVGNGEPDFRGEGEILHISAMPSKGRRTLTADPTTSLISDETYDVIPTPYVITRYGMRDKMVALTFDDGPDGRWTPKILDILKAKAAPATFFVIGQNMQKRPDLVAREVAEGNVVGSHTWTHPNIAEVPPAETDLELNATQRLFETITGRSMRFFRPPFFGDAEPSTDKEVMPLVIAQNLGYYTAGLRIDPDDWQKPTSDQIIQRVLARLDNPNGRPGQVVLLHDAGGDRRHTVQALPGLIDAIRARGYKLVTVAELAGMTQAQALPPTARDSVSLLLDRMGFGFFRGLSAALQVLFITAIALGVGRLVFLACLALYHRFSFEPPQDLDPATGPLVSVLIPCFNEEKVIASSVERILASEWKNLEVIVLDDGSADGTSEEVRKHFADEPRVRLFTFENGGKARALNRGLQYASGEVVVALDADTLFPPATIGRLVRWFADPGIGAVAGNALVGNRLNIVTRWQALEYVTAQNLERRALAALGAVTVVPGAVGAWRRSALDALGGYPDDTLAEDQDMTIAVQRAGWKVGFDPQARAWTEAPDTVEGLLKQRFRWSFGTLQCIWKHRAALFDRKRPVLGFIALPQIWLFQIVLAAAAPLVDLAVVAALVTGVFGVFFHPVEWNNDDLIRSLLYWAVFIFVDISAGALGMALERQAPWKDLIWLPIQRFGYRQLMYYVVLKALNAAVHGRLVGWGKLERRATAVEGAA
jgi:cellulose synthase/poly-beta-1,6-N-acetylglucosamine synthase-like glycosyltransferase/spore germination protein YaaH/peptidoglycan/xylan/chitin deacetylase (PgdA/CDA1 family)